MARSIMWRLLPCVLSIIVAYASLEVRVNTKDAAWKNELPPKSNDKDSSHRYFWLRKTQTAQEARHFKLLTPQEIRDQLLEWADTYPDLCRLTSSQDEYGLPRAGGAADCPFDDEAPGCKNYILTVQDFVAHPQGSDSSKRLPEVFWSGELHGNERVGPTAVMEAATLLLEAAWCEAKPNLSKKNGHSASAWEKELAAAKKCRADLSNKGIDDAQRQWLARLATTRRIVIVPTANALGYYRNERTEEGIDPNRDFPYDLTDSNLCMQTIAGRTLNEIFRQHMFQLSLTFHGGMEVVAYEWGAPSYLKHFSPDDQAQADIANAYSRYAGGWSGTQSYNVGTMNDMVYYVRGGMEDWAYAGSWDPERVIPCTPRTYTKYKKSRTIYNNSTLRVFNMLIETSDKKEPPKQMLGTTLDVLNADTTGNGHVSRNIRLALLAADTVEPYVSIIGANDLFLTDDVIPLSQRGDGTCQRTKSVMIPSNTDEVVIYWTVGGAMTVDDTSVWYGHWNDLADSSMDCLLQPASEDIQESFHQGIPTSSTNGTGRFSKAGSEPRSVPPELGTAPTLGNVFSARIDVSKYQPLDKVAVVAVARVDQTWRHEPDNIAPEIPPQSHIVNARTNPSWKHESAGKIVEGRLDWYSIPLTVVIGDYKDSVGMQSGRLVGTIEVSNRYGETTGVGNGGITPKSDSSGQYANVGWKHLVAVLVTLSIASVVCILWVRRRRRIEHHRLVNELYEEEDHFTGVKPYSDRIDEEEEHDDDGHDGGDLELKEVA